jgi:hypothetical protein
VLKEVIPFVRLQYVDGHGLVAKLSAEDILYALHRDQITEGYVRLQGTGCFAGCNRSILCGWKTLAVQPIEVRDGIKPGCRLDEHLK